MFGHSRTVTGTRCTRLLAMPCRFQTCSVGWLPWASVARASSSQLPGSAVQGNVQARQAHGCAGSAGATSAGDQVTPPSVLTSTPVSGARPD